MKSNKDKVFDYLEKNPDELKKQGLGSLDNLSKQFPKIEKKYLSKVKARYRKRQGQTETSSVTSSNTKQKKSVTPSIIKSVTDVFTDQEVSTLKEIAKQYKVTPDVISSNTTVEALKKINKMDFKVHSVRISKELLTRSKKQAKIDRLSLKEFINLALYEKLEKPVLS